MGCATVTKNTGLSDLSYNGLFLAGATYQLHWLCILFQNPGGKAALLVHVELSHWGQEGLGEPSCFESLCLNVLAVGTGRQCVWNQVAKLSIKEGRT